MRLLILSILAAAVLTFACADPAANKTKATVGNAAPESGAAKPANAETLPITAENSKVEFVAAKVTRSHNGSFKRFSGTIDLTNNKPEDSRVSIDIEANSVETDEPDLTKHLQTPDFFDVAKFPQASFVSTEIKPGGTNGATHTVTGNLTMHGVTKSVTFPATINVTPDLASVDSSFSINRKDFGIVYAGAPDNLIRDNVVLKLTIRANKA